MLDHISIFTKTGIILWSKTFCKLTGNPVEELIDTVLLEEKGGDKSTVIGNYALKWTLANELDIVFVVVYSKLLTLLYVEDLLSFMKKTFVSLFKESILKTKCVRVQFDAEFDKALNEAETIHMQNKKLKNTPKHDYIVAKKSSSDVTSGLESNNETGVTTTSSKDGNIEEEEDDEDDGEEPAADEGPSENAIARLQARHAGRKAGKTVSLARKSKSAASEASTETKAGPTKKEARVWAGGTTGKASAKTAAALDRSKPAADASAGEEAGEDREVEQARATYLPEEGERPMWETEAEEAQEFEAAMREEAVASAASEASSATTDSGGWSFSKTYLGDLLQTVTGNKVLEESDLAPVLAKVQETLQGKNVAQEIADDICSSVGSTLVGHKLASFTRVHTVVVNALKEAVERVLTPKTSTDILRQVLDAKAEGRVFSAVFVGINGVGKSTSLAKVAYYLQQHGVKVMLAACDTFRSGAVEQLKTHARCLDAPLFAMGYAKDPSRVAAAALLEAKEKKYDCVLIDTAGRMQNNEPLMRALSTLVIENSPNLVLFVGEALVGNDGIDQLSMFDKALINYSPPGKMHRIDGIVLTKFDTIDDKVGAALSMSYKSGKPIMFVGTGQKYTHLKKLNVNTVIKHLFSV